MEHSSWRRRLLACLVAAGWLCAAVAGGRAAEETQRFLDGLRERGLYDVALDYLQQMRTSPLADQDFKTVIDYEAGVTLISASQIERVASVRQQRLDEAYASLQTFIDEHPQHPLAASANTRLADVLVERGRIQAEEADKPSQSADERAQLKDEARTLFRKAEGVLKDLDQRFLEEHRTFPKVIDPKETERIEAREQVRRNLLQARLALATVIYEIAHTYAPDSKESREHLTAAAAKYNDMYSTYGEERAILGGLYARMYEGRCYKELGDTEKALKAFADLLVQPDEPQAFRIMKNKALVFLLETALAGDDPQYDEAVKKYQAWDQTARGAEESSADGLAIKYLSGEAFFERSKQQKKADDRKADLTEARKLFNYVADRPGEYQSRAKAMLWRKELAGEDVEIPEPTNFAEARDRGKDALDRMQAPNIEPPQAARFRAEAIKYFRMAVTMKTPEVTVDEMNVIRYYLAYLYWTAGDLYEAAVAGEFLARRYSDSAGARQAAKIAMAAYVTLFNQAPEDDREFESQRMTGIAEYIAERWAGEPEADDAWMMLIRAALGEGDLARAQQYLAKIPAESARRGEAELLTGQRLWANYLLASAKEESERPPQAKLDAMVAQAQQTLEDGINRMRKSVDAGGQVTYTLVASALSLAQINIGAGEPEKAIPWLDDPKIGAHTLVKANDPATDRGKFRVETYKAALRAYVATQRLDEAEQVMQALETLVQQQGDADAGGTLTRIYISLGRELQQQLERLRKEKNTEQVGKVAGAFELFLDRIRGRQKGNTYNSLNWVAETFFGLGAGFDLGGGGALSPKAENYYGKAAETYRDILHKCEESEKEKSKEKEEEKKKLGEKEEEKQKQEEFKCPPAACNSVKIRLARCLGRLGQRKDARGLLVEVLKQNNLLLEAQLEAAYLYQDWGEDNPTAYTLAIRGSTSYKEIWGWGGIANRVARSPKHQSIFHEARYNLALCRFKLAMSKSGTEKKDLLEQAKKDVLIIQRLYPEMGGNEWFAKYDDLLKKTQRLLGETPGGLKAAAKQNTATGSTRPGAAGTPK